MSVSMGETVEFVSNGSSASGYLALPATGSGPGLIVIQEWWGLNNQIRGVTDRLAAEGFVALAPDLFHGELAGHDEMDKAASMMATLDPAQAARDMSGAIDQLVSLDALTGDGVGVVGFCMGGMLSWLIATDRPDMVKAVVPFYGFPQGDDEPDWSLLDASVQGHMAEFDAFFGPDAARSLESRLQAMGKDVVLTVHPGTGHAFMNEENALGTHNATLAAELWPQVAAFLHEKLDPR